MGNKVPDIKLIYNILLKKYGYQGWWPLTELSFENPDTKGYHINDYSFPKTELQRFEIGIGAILTQNTSWKQVEIAIENLMKLELIDPKKLLNANENIVKKAIKPAGYFNQKYKKLIIFSRFFIDNDKLLMKLKKKYENSNDLKTIDKMRQMLLELWGIGKETADSILLYAYSIPIFVIDAYTKRIFKRLGFEFNEYDDLQEIFHKTLSRDFKVYQEYHALLVEHAKQHCKTKPLCNKCPLIQFCKFKSN